MKRLNIAACVTTLIALVGYILECFKLPGGVFVFSVGMVASALFWLINAFWLISKKQLSSGACMYCVLFEYLFVYFYVLNDNASIGLYCTGIGFLVLAFIAKIIEKNKAKKRELPFVGIDKFVSFAFVVVVMSSLLLAI